MYSRVTMLTASSTGRGRCGSGARSSVNAEAIGGSLAQLVRRVQAAVESTGFESDRDRASRSKRSDALMFHDTWDWVDRW